MLLLFILLQMLNLLFLFDCVLINMLEGAGREFILGVLRIGGKIGGRLGVIG